MLHLTKAGRLIAIATLGGAAVLGSAVNAAAPAAADDSKLMTMLPPGFSSTNCQEAEPRPPALEKVSCDANTVQGGPVAGVFALYGSAADLATGFQALKLTASACPDGQPSPSSWGYGNDRNAGQVECGTILADSGASSPVVAWTDNAKLRAGAVQGPDISSLYQWWKSRG